tara:strand:- start:161 stop:409 length:249 start_codon:yes stop_codon:yes gene_type:complete
MDAVDFAIQSWADRFTNEKKDIELYEEVLINSFFRAVREDIVEDTMSHDAEIMVVLDMMNHTMKGTDDEHADILSRYLGVRV